MESKRCVQCGRTLSMANFAKYKSRSKGVYNTTVGHHTVCRECERFNASVIRIWKKDVKSEEDLKLLEDAKKCYRRLAGNGLQPKGAYAKHVLNVADDQDTTKAMHDSYAAMIGQVATVGSEDIMNSFRDLLSMDLVEEPDVYGEMLDAVQERCMGADGRVAEEYRDINLQVIVRLDAYEDKYWEEH